jgi:hypothetical protein
VPLTRRKVHGLPPNLSKCRSTCDLHTWQYFPCLLNLAIALRLLGDFGEARDLGAETLERCRMVFGPDHPRTFVGRSNLVIGLRLLGDFGEARDLGAETLAVQEHGCGPCAPKRGALPPTPRRDECRTHMVNSACDYHTLPTYVGRLRP